MKRILLSSLICCFLSPAGGRAQESEGEPSGIITDWDEAPVYLSGGPNLSRYSSKEVSNTFPFRFLGEGGFLFQYSLMRKYPFISGIEFQMRGYEINTSVKGVNQLGKSYELRNKGQARINFLNLPFLFIVPAGKPNKKLRFLAGTGISVRVYARQKYSGTYVIPEDTLVIPISEDRLGNDAIDLIDFNLTGGVLYTIAPRLDLMALGTYKAGGFSIGQENFISRDEGNILFSVKLLYRFARMEHIPFF